MLQSLALAIVDVETTGCDAAEDRVIEIGLHRIERGRLAASYSTLLNPGRSLPPIITQITGITDEDVADAPVFSEVAARVRALLDGCIFVAHNVRFDYGFLRHEFERVGPPYAAECLCSVRLSRALYPQHHRHNLSALIERFNVPCARRHRALDDASVVWAFLQQAHREHPRRMAQAVRQLLQAPVLPPALSAEMLEAVPDASGVYVFYDAAGAALYVGSSREMRERVASHFSSEVQSPRKVALFQRVTRIETHPTFGELGLRLWHAELLRRLAPSGNVMPACGRPRHLRPWPYGGLVLVEEASPRQAAGHLFVLDEWRLIKALCYDGEEVTSWFAGAATVDRDVYTILTRYLPARAHRIKPLSRIEAARLLGEHEDQTNALASRSRVRMRMTRSMGSTAILPSPTLPE